MTRAGSTRILFDLQACQTIGSGRRGVGRQAQALFDAVRAQGGPRDIRALVAEGMLYEPDLGTISGDRVLRLPELPDWHTPRAYAGGEQDRLDALAYMALANTAAPDVIHIGHPFEGFNDRVALPTPAMRAPGQILSATLHDLIPAVFPDAYFKDEAFRRWYQDRMGWLRQADLLLAVSESSRQDAISLLGIDPDRIVTIWGGVFSHFVPAAAADKSRLKADLCRRFDMRSRFVLYTGGDDFRKNISGAIEGFAALPRDRRQDCTLVIICAMEEHRRHMYLDIARRAGLSGKDVLITGFVEEADLVAFKQCCDAFLFPSLYEGFGFPIVEAMACGVPVIGGNNSSIRDIIRREDALFDAAKPEAIAERLGSVLADEGFARELGQYGLTRARDFTWERTASVTLEAFDAALDRSRERRVQVALSADLPRKRLAVFSPLPPLRSGIADYNARFLPFLARHFEIDLYVEGYAVEDEELTSLFRIFDVKDFERVADNYDIILYEFGNSEFHSHMLHLLRKFPGVVGLHDAYLSGLMWYQDGVLGDEGSYPRAMIEAHGSKARRYFAPVAEHPDPSGGAIVNLPCTREVLRHAQGVISHSPFNLDLAEDYYPERWRAPYHIIPQMVPVAPVIEAEARDALRRELGFGQDDIVITTFGHVAWTKWGDRLLDAVETPGLVKNKRVHLVYAGQMEAGQFGMDLTRRIEKSALRDRIRVTGYLSDADYERYLNASDIGVQLRTKSRGGTPKGVLDCMSHGIPVLINNDASYRDYPDDVVVKLDPDPAAEDIAGILGRLVANAAARREVGERGRSYVKAVHAPVICAAHYAASLNAFADRAARAAPAAVIRAMAPHVAHCRDPQAAGQAAVAWLRSMRPHGFHRPRLLIDVSFLSLSDHQTGIPRVVKEITKALYCMDRADFEPLAVQLIGDTLHTSPVLLRKLGLLHPAEAGGEEPVSVTVREGDIILMLDSSWQRYHEFEPVFVGARRLGVPIYTVVYDLLPMLLPPDCVVEGGKQWFEGWITSAAEASDGMIGISRAVADDVIDFLDARPQFDDRDHRIGFWHLGADFANQSPNAVVAPDVAGLKGKNFLLMVGTIEPRKSHARALDAMEMLWKQGSDLALCIAGRPGWLIDALMERLRNHPERGRRLFLFEDASDSDIGFMYQNAAALFFLSQGEGFGLPLVEAAHYGTAIICSDLPVFHEIAGDFATYVDHRSASATSQGISQWYVRWKKGEIPSTSDMPRKSWVDSAEQLVDVVINNQWVRS